MENGNAVDWFVDRHVRDGGGDRLAFRDPWRDLTYGALQTETRRFAGALRRAGIARERRVVLLLQDTIDFPIAFWGAIRAGVVPVPINTLLTAETVRYVLDDSRAGAVIVSAPVAAALTPALLDSGSDRLLVISQPDGSSGTPVLPGAIDLQSFLAGADAETSTTVTPADEVAFWLYSSGSTGAPKGVRHVHASLRVTADTYGARVLGIRQDDVMFSVAKAFHAYGLGNSLTFPQSVGAATVFLPDRPTPDAVLGMMAKHNPTLFAGVPTLYAAMLANPMLMPGAGSQRLRRCISAGEALPADIGHRWKSVVGVDILDGIGSTEMLHIFISNDPDDIRYGTTGRPVPGYEARVVDEHDRPVPNGEAGELVVRGDSAAEGYWNQRAKSRRTFQGEWTYTGDTYIRDADGYFRFCGRRDEMLKVSGVWVSPFEVEEALISHPAVLEAAVVGREDDAHLTKPKA
ncbi:MAG: benzoate-CoA ligase family protein, partial [Proteobacteria bacterium]|nr:benzoate-CoA ligase family protein [Pseudomonadota bacterium]